MAGADTARPSVTGAVRELATVMARSHALASRGRSSRSLDIAGNMTRVIIVSICWIGNFIRV